MPKIGDAYVNITPKAENIKAEVEKLLGDAGLGGTAPGKKTGSSFMSGMKTVVTAAAVGKVIKDAFDAGGAIQQSFGGLETLYADAADGAKTYAMAAAEAGISANSYAEQAVSFGAALKAAYDGDTTAAMEAANTAILDMADNAAKMGTPLESIQQAYQGFARGQYQLLDNLKLGYGGTKTEMERLLADAQKLTGVKYDINNLGDVYDAIHVIQGELGLTGVAAEEAKTTLLGSAGAMKASWENLLAAMMTGEGLDEAFEHLTESSQYFVENVLTMFGNLTEQAPELILGFLDVLIANAPELIAGGIEMLAQLAVGIIQAIPDLVSKIPEIFTALKEGFNLEDWKSIGTDILQAVWDGLVELWSSVVDWFNDRVSSLHGTAYIDVYTRDHTTVNAAGFSHSTGKFATGLDYVPYNEFPAILHQGEMIVPAGLATQLRAAGINPDTKSLNQTSSHPAAAAPAAVNVNIAFEGSLAQLARVLQPYIKVEEDRRGPKLIK